MDYFDFAKQHENEHTTFTCIPTKVTRKNGAFAVKQSDHHGYDKIKDEKAFFDSVKSLSKIGGNYTYKIPHSRNEYEELEKIHELARGTRFKFIRAENECKFSVFFKLHTNTTGLEIVQNMFPEGNGIKYNKSLLEAFKKKHVWMIYNRELSFMFNDEIFVDMLPFLIGNENVELLKMHVVVKDLAEAKNIMERLS